MTVDCKWMNTNLEAYCCDRLSSDELRQAKSHIENCQTCQEELRDLRAVDPLVKELFRYRLAVARTPAAPRRLVPAAAAVALAGGVLAIALLVRPGSQPIELPSPSLPTRSAVEQIIPKDTEAGVTRAKPDATAALSPSAGPVNGSTAGNSSEAFAVIDPAGYVRRLEDYRGNVLVFGVWSPDQPQAARNLEAIYRTFTTNTRFRLLGISNRRQQTPAGITFPVVYNHESRLLGARESEFVVIDGTGAERLRGSLLTDTAGSLQRIRAILER